MTEVRKLNVRTDATDLRIILTIEEAVTVIAALKDAKKEINLKNAKTIEAKLDEALEQ